MLRGCFRVRLHNKPPYDTRAREAPPRAVKAGEKHDGQLHQRQVNQELQPESHHAHLHPLSTTLSLFPQGRETTIQFDPTISLGTIIQVAMFLGGACVIYGRFVSLETRVDAIWKWFIKEREDR